MPAGGDLRRPGLATRGLFLLLAAWAVVMVLVPVLGMVGYGFCDRDETGDIEYSFTIANYASLFEPLYLKILWRSVREAGLVTLLCLLLGYPAAWVIGRSPPQRRRRLLVAVMVPFWTSFLLRAYAWTALLSTQGWINTALLGVGATSAPLEMLYTPGAARLGLVHAYLPFMMVPIFSSIEKLDGTLLEAAHDLGASRLRVFVDIILPLTRPGIIAGVTLTFVPAIGMFAIVDLLGGGRSPLIGNVIQNQFGQAHNWPFGAALGTLLILIFAIPYWFGAREERAQR